MVFQVGPLALDVTEEGLDPRLIGRRMRAAVVLGDRHQRHEGAGGLGFHRRTVVGDGQQDRPSGVVGVQVEALVGEQLQR
jgi:hypothetical protein